MRPDKRISTKSTRRGNVDYPSAEASSVLHLPSGDSILAAVNMFRVAGSSVSKAAEIMPLMHFLCCSNDEAKAVAESVEEHAVSMLIAGPVLKMRVYRYVNIEFDI